MKKLALVTALCSGILLPAIGWTETDAVLENPANGSFQSGISLISGWVCDAEAVEITIDNLGEIFTIPVAYGTSRGDTSGVCGDSDNGFGYTINMGDLEPGEHEVVAYADGVEFGRSTFTTTQLSTGAFSRGLFSELVVRNFPQAGQSVTLVWQEANQNFVIKEESGGASGGVQYVFKDGEPNALWNAGIAAFDEQIDYNSCGGKGEDCPSISWDYVFDFDGERGPVLEVTYAGPGLAGLFFSADPSVDMSAFAGGTLNFDVRVLDEGNNTSGFYMKVDCVFPCTSGDQVIGVKGLSAWETVTVPVDQLVGGGLDLTKVNTGLVIFPTPGEQTGFKFQLDNVYWQSAM